MADNGHGLPEDMVGKPYSRDKMLAGNHLGLYNVDTILSKHYGDGCGLYLDAGPGGIGTAVTATLPIRLEDPLC